MLRATLPSRSLWGASRELGFRSFLTGQSCATVPMRIHGGTDLRRLPAEALVLRFEGRSAIDARWAGRQALPCADESLDPLLGAWRSRSQRP